MPELEARSSGETLGFSEQDIVLPYVNGIAPRCMFHVDLQEQQRGFNAHCKPGTADSSARLDIFRNYE
ncbi:MAG TPA: hypothetical protein VFL79_18325, partial [Terriglobia bacterium]|nr:hypothetical protein [Terriglobia bacterium]